MTIEETRQLGIEFERRVQTMIPDREYIDKLDTDTIYSFLNQYQDKYVHEIYRNLDKIESGSKLSAHVEAVLQSLQKSKTLSVSNSSDVIKNFTSTITDENYVIADASRSIVFKLPPEFYMYIRSVSNVSKTYGFRSNSTNGTASSDAQQNLPIRVIPNELVSQSDVWRLIETPHNSLRILRYPAAVLSEPYHGKDDQDRDVVYPTLTCIYDQYTKVEGVKVLYYKQPAYFSILEGIACELPADAFDDLVTGAVDLYIQYVSNNRPTDRSRQPIIPASETAKAKEEAQRSQRNRKKQDED